MSQENVEKLTASLAVWDGVVLRPEERPFERIFSLESVTAVVNADGVYESAVLPDQAGEVYRGSDAWTRAAETWIAPCEWMVVDLEQVLDAGDQVVSLHRARMKMRETTLEFDMPVAYVYTFSDGNIVHTRAFADHSEALMSAGLAE
ncbi:MAG TPA: nuclear transport factor 2 family protein [Solirubrobacteraceae bacterium]|nr:nuclear transport factor 2 family protein [Solirubrobacteraceae bacterium]